MARIRRRRYSPEEGIGGLLILVVWWLWAKVGSTGFYVIIGSVIILAVGITILLKRFFTTFS